MKRRDLLKGAGAAGVVVAGGVTWRAHDRGVWSRAAGPAYEPWESWRGKESEGAFALVRAGILAANPHNTQPWRFRVEHARVDLLADLRRNLGSFDVYRRELFLGLGCVLENLMLAARAHGYEPTLTLAEGRLDPPPSGPQPVFAARIDLAPAPATRSVLYDAIPRRHTNRGPYDTERALPPDIARALHALGEAEPDIAVTLISDPVQRHRFGECIVDSTEAIIADATMVHDSERWYRHSRKEIRMHRDGPTLDATGLHPLRIALAKFLPRPSAEQNHAYWLASTRDVHVATAPVFGMIAVRDLYDIGQTLRAGRLWQRLHLWGVTHGLALQPLNQPVELVDRERSLGREPRMALRLSAFTAETGWQPTFAFRAGYPLRAVPPSPRRPVEDVIM